MNVYPTNTESLDVAVGNGALYWDDMLPTDTTWVVRGAPTAGGGDTATFATGQLEPTRIVVDRTNIYWTNQGGTMMMVPLVGGGTPAPVMPSLSTVSDLTLDGTYIYWAERNGTLGKIPIAGGSPVTLATVS